MCWCGVSLRRYPMRPLRPRHHLLGAEQRRALEMLAATELNGCSGATLLAQGFRVGMLADLVSDGLATAHRETMKEGKCKTARVRIRITDAGRQALEG
jgi:DNA-binding PadR family transcriptional regulator